jgi:ABC-type transport system involved in multi-copper enzyme maturation permease subunit
MRWIILTFATILALLAAWIVDSTTDQEWLGRPISNYMYGGVFLGIAIAIFAMRMLPNRKDRK